MSAFEYQELGAYLRERFEIIDRGGEADNRRCDELCAETLGHFDAVYRRLRSS